MNGRTTIRVYRVGIESSHGRRDRLLTMRHVLLKLAYARVRLRTHVAHDSRMTRVKNPRKWRKEKKEKTKETVHRTF